MNMNPILHSMMLFVLAGVCLQGCGASDDGPRAVFERTSMKANELLLKNSARASLRPPASYETAGDDGSGMVEVARIELDSFETAASDSSWNDVFSGYLRLLSDYPDSIWADDSLFVLANLYGVAGRISGDAELMKASLRSYERFISEFPSPSIEESTRRIFESTIWDTVNSIQEAAGFAPGTNSDLVILVYSKIQILVAPSQTNAADGPLMSEVLAELPESTFSESLKAGLGHFGD